MTAHTADAVDTAIARQPFLTEHPDRVAALIRAAFADHWVEVTDTSVGGNEQIPRQEVPTLILTMGPEYIQISCVGGSTYDLISTADHPARLETADTRTGLKVTLTRSDGSVLTLTVSRSVVATDFRHVRRTAQVAGRRKPR